MIFDYSRFMDIRNRDIALPANEYRQFKIVVDQELDDRESPLRELIRGGRKARTARRSAHVEITAETAHALPDRPRRAVADRRERGRDRSRELPVSDRGLPGRARRQGEALASRDRRAVANRSQRLSIATASRNFSRKARVLVPVERGVRRLTGSRLAEARL